MNNIKHRLGVNEANLVSRHLKLESIDDIRLNEALLEMNQLYGIDTVFFDQSTHILNLEYDASRLCLDDIEKILHQYNLVIGQGWWNLFKKGYYQFVDQNIKDNATHEPSCCNKVPPEARRR